MRKYWIMGAVAALLISGCNKQETAVLTPTPAAKVELSPELAGRFSTLALECVHREFPNKIGHVFTSAADVGTPSQLHPAFYGCFDWHSSVHGHWLLVRLLHVGPEDAPWRADAIAKLSQSFTAENIAVEVAYFGAPNRASYERPYGVAWLLQLTENCESWPKKTMSRRRTNGWQHWNHWKPLSRPRSKTGCQNSLIPSGWEPIINLPLPLA